ncbi:hypothetical protein [Spiroplasma endosymbiont of Cantharis rufa]|uniref:hypothetical protein n=1 Tax=Spiroplasma endosymbiont of Cantharis rufa TaxID=3066279 RepID=UPI0030D09382
MKDIKKNISFFTIFKYQFKSIIREKTFMIMYLISISLSLLVGLMLALLSSSETKVIVFNYYVLIHTCAIVILITMRLMNYFFYIKKADKTINIISIQHLKRTKLFVVTNFVIWLYCYLLFLLNYLFISLLNFNNIVVIRIASVYTFYLFLIVILLSNFILFLFAISSPQLTIIIVTLLMSFSFISSLPYQFLKTSEKSKNLSFSGEDGNVTLRVDNLYESFDLVSRINKSEIAYPNLSKYILDCFLENKFRTSTFSNEEGIEIRKKIWKDLGIIDDNPVVIKFKGKISSVPFNSDISDWEFGDEIEVETFLKYKFISLRELNNLINKTDQKFIDENGHNKYLILKEIYEFHNFIYDHFYSFQERFYYLFDDYIQLESCENFNESKCWNLINEQGKLERQKNGYIELVKKSSSNLNTKETESNKRAFKLSYLTNIYQNYFTNLAGLRLQTEDAKNIVTTDMDSSYIQDAYSALFNPLMITTRILEDYFISYISNYVVASTYTINGDSDEWKDYIKSRKIYNATFNFNFLSNVLLNYTYYSGLSYGDVWFNPEVKSNLILDSQKNLLLPYSTFTFKLNQNKIDALSYNNTAKPYFYLIVQFIISAVLFAIAFYKFNNADLQ